MLKLEIKLDENKILADQKYKVESIYQALEQAFAKYRLNKTQEPDGTLCFFGNGNPKDYGAFGCIITSLKELVCSLPIITIGASTTALYTVMLKLVKNEEGYIFKGFLHAFKLNFKQSTII